MPDEKTRWERTETAAEAEGRRFRARQSVEHHKKAPDALNPYALEAARDRLLLKWTAAVAVLVLLAAWQAWMLLRAG